MALAGAGGCDEVVTIEGEISVRGSEPFARAVITTADDRLYTLSGEYAGELKRLAGTVVSVTARIGEPELPRTEADLKVKKYRILDPGYDPSVDWIVGKIELTGEGYRLITEDKVKYKIRSIDRSTLKEKLSGTKSLLFGRIEFENDTVAVIHADGYKVLRER